MRGRLARVAARLGGASASVALLRSAAAPESLVALVEAHEAWLVEAVDERRGVRGWQERQRLDHELRGDLRAASPDHLRAASAVAHARLREGAPRGGLWLSVEATILGHAARRRVSWSVEEVTWLADCVAAHIRRTTYPEASQACTVVLRAAEALDPDSLPGATASVQRLAEELARHAAHDTDSAAAARRVTTLLHRDATHSDDVVPAGFLEGVDGYAPAARAALLDRFAGSEVAPVLRRLYAYRGAVRPTVGWRTATERLVAEDPHAVGVLEVLLLQALRHRETLEQIDWYGNETTVRVFASPDSTAVLRAAVWAWTFGPATPSAVRVLGDLAVVCGTGAAGDGMSRCAPVASSALAALSDLASRSSGTDAAGPVEVSLTDAVVAALTRARDTIRNRKLRKDASAALAAAAEAAGVTEDELLERAVPDHGLAPDGTAEVAVGDHVALLRLVTGSAGAKLEMRWRTPTGRVVASVPATVREGHPGALAGLRATAKQAKKDAANQRQRLEDLMARDRRWSARDWARFYPRHPVVGLHARSLIWQVRPDGDDAAPWVSGLPEPDGESWSLVDHDGTRRPVTDEHVVRLWHPIREPLPDIAAWRAHLGEREVRQPFKQAHREIYLLTPAEEQTRTYSNRFAAHILRYPQVGALIRTRGWSASHLGYWDGGYETTASKELPGGWVARFDLSLVEREEDQADQWQASLAGTDQVRFERWTGRRTGEGWQAQPLADVPDLVFSEAMRDVDLFVGVASIAADATWADRGTDRHRAYWHVTSFGELSESAQVRREALATLLPKTRLADRAELDGNFLVVHGHLRDYRIHLGSTNILMSPADTYLCIVPARGRDPRVFLPFEEGGGKLSVILSKAFLLAEDASITDPSITQQLRLGLT